MGVKLVSLIESLDSPFDWRSTFKTEKVEKEDEDGNPYEEEVFQPVQIIQFSTDAGVPYVWYARQNRYDETMWEIAFGKRVGETLGGGHQLDIETTGDGNAMRVFATVIEITNAFIDLDENYEVQRLIVSSKGSNRTNLYMKRILPRLENFEIGDTFVDGAETKVHLERKY